MTREDLARVRATLARVREYSDLVDESEVADIAAVIAHMDALLSLTDAQCAEVAEVLGDDAETEESWGKNAYMPRAVALRTVAAIVRRTA